ncbi:MAG: flagellar hook basal-body protein [Planctomycetaceae bacterium]
MVPGLYSAASGLDVAALNQDVIARNLANSDVPGFRRGQVSFGSFEGALGQFGGVSVGTSTPGTTDAVMHTDFAPGSFQHTGNPLDVAILGEGFFVLEGSSGPLYTRNGVFHLSAEGQLVSGSGLPVQGGGGPITIPKEAPLSTVRIMSDGSVSANGVQVGKLQIVDFSDKDQLTSVGTTAFSATNSSAAQPVASIVEQGSRELSNVNAVEELTRMIINMRLYEAAQRALNSISSAIEQNIGTQSG